ncbi:MAG: ATP-binding protein [Thermoproteota archaeon]|jgi:Predicted ATPase (AAA+ superfamily)
MRTEDFKHVITEWLTKGPPNTLEREISIPLESNLIITVTGGRRTGKTYLLFNTINKLIRENKAKINEILYIDFEHSRLKAVKVNDLDDMLKAFMELTGNEPSYIFLDEIHNVENYGSWFRKRLNAKIYLSGSSSSLTPRKIAEELRGRSINYEIYPLSFREYLYFLKEQFDPKLLSYTEYRGRILSFLREYLYYGAYPAVIFEKEKEKLLKSYFDSIIVRDLRTVNPEIAEAFASYIISNYSSLITVNRVYNYLKSLGYKIGKEKVLELFDKSKESYFAFYVEIFNKSEIKRKVNPKKVYIIDTGYSTALGYEFSISKAMENAVYLELMRRNYGDIYYWKEFGGSEGKEVDFVIAKNFQVEEIIQVTYATDVVEEREINAIKKAKKELNPKKITVITWDYENKENEIDYVPLWKWFLLHY